MKYIVISNEGDLTEHDGHLDFRTLLGPEGKARVLLHSAYAAAGWVNDCGLLFPQQYPRNVIGSCVLAAMGADMQPYAGPIVFTGWDVANTALGRLELLDTFRPGLPELIALCHANVRRALAGEPVVDLTPSWAEQTREIADHVRTAATPGLTITTGRTS
ncbi:hypothetical protein AB0M87_04800 [Streptomyces sp. NPDC051320]|uniref:hypothetical protein n=1 Tax=Streptomyces sp. NPDC051320 TaxID=3154644 RepID=UPI00343F3987